MLTKAMAVELAPYGITVNAIAPGWIRTEMSERDLASVAGMEAKVIQHTPLRRIGEPLDVANLVAFLCSDDAKWITGQIFTVDGGFEIWKDV
jgi:NAD(P)-dependent dehydrogenase (short-subunit alcohol dehydrogenase family)